MTTPLPSDLINTVIITQCCRRKLVAHLDLHPCRLSFRLRVFKNWGPEPPREKSVHNCARIGAQRATDWRKPLPKSLSVALKLVIFAVCGNLQICGILHYHDCHDCTLYGPFCLIKPVYGLESSSPKRVITVWMLACSTIIKMAHTYHFPVWSEQRTPLMSQRGW